MGRLFISFLNVVSLKNFRGKAGYGSQNGSTAVELALVFPILISILFGFIQFGLILSTSLSLENAAAIGARTAATGASNEVVSETIIQSLSASVKWNYSGQDSATTIPDYTLPSGVSASRVELVHHMPLMIPFIVPGSQNGFLELSSAAVNY